MTKSPSRARRLLRDIVRRIPLLRRHLLSSSDYKIISREDAYREGAFSWSRRLTTRRQGRTYENLLKRMYDGEPRVDFLTAKMAIQRTGLAQPKIIEVGCGNGYYTEVFAHLLDRKFDYLGIDFSRTMIDSAKRSYPSTKFQVGDACALKFPDGSFDIVFNGVSLMHIIDFENAISESRRVSRGYCIFHSVPVLEKSSTTYLRKYAYGGAVTEVIFNRSHLLELFDRNGLQLLETWKSIPYDVYPVIPEHSYTETLLLKVRGSTNNGD
jgi:SAM-dependent methyltransferase